MDLEKRAKLRGLRVIISEVIMVLAVIVTVAVLAFIVSGYWLNSDFEVQRQGMLQVYSMPTGANVEIDGDAPWFQRTNTSKVMPSGEHSVVLTKEGYDSWSKTINISEGLLYRLNYPQLFLKERKKEAIYDATTTTFATISPNRKLMLLTNNTTTWTILNLDSDEPKPTTIDIKGLFSSVASDTTTSLFTGEILSADWDYANEHILFNAHSDTGSEWVLLNVKRPTESINLTREFTTDFSDVGIFDNAANNLLAIRNGNLHKINTSSRQISAVLLEDVQEYDFRESEIVFVSKGQLVLAKIESSDTPTILEEEIISPAKVFLSKFYDNEYIFVIESERIKVYQKENYNEVFDAEIGFTPEYVKVGYSGEFVVMGSGNSFATLDMESMNIRKWEADSAHYGWLNSYMLYSVNDGEFYVYDFDGLNRRELVTNVSSRFPAAITNNKWLYYFSDDVVMREKIVD